MFDTLNTIALSGREYPIKCDLLVLERIQEAYGSIKAFEGSILTWRPVLDGEGKEVVGKNGKQKVAGQFPEAKAVNDALYWMAEEGEEIAAEKDGRAPEKLVRESLIRKVDLTLHDLAVKVYEEFYHCFESKNGTATQGTQEGNSK